MDMVILNMPMPKNCFECKIYGNGNNEVGVCPLTNEYNPSCQDQRGKDCPIVCKLNVESGKTEELFNSVLKQAKTAGKGISI